MCPRRSWWPWPRWDWRPASFDETSKATRGTRRWNLRKYLVGKRLMVATYWVFGACFSSQSQSIFSEYLILWNSEDQNRRGSEALHQNASWRRTGLHCMCLFVYVKFVNRTAPLFTATGPILKRFEKLVMLSTNQTINPFPWQIMPKEKNPWGHCNCSFVAICSALLLGYVFHFSFAGNACTTRMSPNTWSSLRMMSKQVTNVWRSLNRSSRTWGCLTHSSHLETC